MNGKDSSKKKEKRKLINNLFLLKRTQTEKGRICISLAPNIGKIYGNFYRQKHLKT